MAETLKEAKGVLLFSSQTSGRLASLHRKVLKKNIHMSSTTAAYARGSYREAANLYEVGLEMIQSRAFGAEPCVCELSAAQVASNLSAALYQLKDYTESAAAAMKAWSLLPYQTQPMIGSGKVKDLCRKKGIK